MNEQEEYVDDSLFIWRTVVGDERHMAISGYGNVASWPAAWANEDLPDNSYKVEPE